MVFFFNWSQGSSFCSKYISLSIQISIYFDSDTMVPLYNVIAINHRLSCLTHDIKILYIMCAIDFFNTTAVPLCPYRRHKQRRSTDESFQVDDRAINHCPSTEGDGDIIMNFLSKTLWQWKHAEQRHGCLWNLTKESWRANFSNAA